LDENKTYLVHKGTAKKISQSKILEPLSMIYSLRTFETNVGIIKEMPVVVKDDIRIYHIEQIGLEHVTANKTKHQAIKYKIQRKEKKNKSFYIWLSNDKDKIPLKIAMDAPLGNLEIQLVKITGTINLAALFKNNKEL